MTTPSANKDTEQLELSHSTCKCKMVQPSLKIAWKFLKKTGRLLSPKRCSCPTYDITTFKGKGDFAMWLGQGLWNGDAIPEYLGRPTLITSPWKHWISCWVRGRCDVDGTHLAVASFGCGEMGPQAKEGSRALRSPTTRNWILTIMEWARKGVLFFSF